MNREKEREKEIGRERKSKKGVRDLYKKREMQCRESDLYINREKERDAERERERGGGYSKKGRERQRKRESE
jgi:hypothetical protein